MGRLKLCGSISGRAIFIMSTLFVLHQDYKHHQLTEAVSSTHFWVFVKISLFLVNYIVSTTTRVRSNKLISLTFSYIICTE
jgi:hypothetical protein